MVVIKILAAVVLTLSSLMLLYVVGSYLQYLYYKRKTRKLIEKFEKIRLEYYKFMYLGEFVKQKKDKEDEKRD